jgi:hypothetical protein
MLLIVIIFYLFSRTILLVIFLKRHARSAQHQQYAQDPHHAEMPQIVSPQATLVVGL